MAELEKVCASALNRKIIRFFHENPSSVDTSRGIAAWLNIERKEAKEALDFLVKQKVLTAHRMGSSIAYAYTQDKKVNQKIDKLLKTFSGEE